MSTLSDAALETGTWVDLDTLSADDLRHLAAAKDLGRTPPEQAEALRGWDEMLQRLADPQRDVDADPLWHLTAEQRAYLSMLTRIAVVAQDLAEERFFSEVEILDSLTRVGAEMGVAAGDAHDAALDGLALAVAA